MAKDTVKKSGEGHVFMGLGGFLEGLGSVIEKLGELAEKGEELQKTGEITDPTGKLKGIYGFNIKMGLGNEELKVEPFGNVRKDEQTGKATVQEVREPMVDVFDEENHVLVVAEMPGIGEGDVELELKEDVLAIIAASGGHKYRKEVLLPAAFSMQQMSHKCHNGVLEVTLAK